MPAGRPSKYKPEFAEQAEQLCKLGATDNDLAQFFKVTTVTLWNWQSRHPEFFKALKVGKAESDERVERSLYNKATGYTFTSEKVFQFQGEIVRAQVTEHVPPSDTSMIFWLKNRRPEQWRDVKESKHSGEINYKHEQVRQAADEFTDQVLGIAASTGQAGSTGKPH